VSTDRITRELGWEPRVDLDDGLRRTIRWYLENRAWLDRTADDAYRAYYEAVYVRGWDRS
jgi:dTDP-glucose 4,6-dehydratase